MAPGIITRREQKLLQEIEELKQKIKNLEEESRKHGEEILKLKEDRNAFRDKYW